MIFAHTIVGLLPVDESQFSLYWLAGSMIPDIDHLYVIYKHKLFTWKKLVRDERFEDKYHMHFKTKYGHSIFGATVATLPTLFTYSWIGQMWTRSNIYSHLVRKSSEDSFQFSPGRKEYSQFY